MLEGNARPVIDPLAEQAATLLTKAMLANRDREALWSTFRDLVEEQVERLQEAPVRQALDDLERRGVSLDLVARLAAERYRARGVSEAADHQDTAPRDGKPGGFADHEDQPPEPASHEYQIRGMATNGPLSDAE